VPPHVLFLTTDVPRNGGSGGQIASWRLLETFAEFGTLDVLALGPAGQEAPRELLELAERVELVGFPHFHAAEARVRTALILAGATIRREPFRIAKMRSKEAAAVVREWSANRSYDLVHCDHLPTTPYRALVPAARAILTAHNVEWQQFAQLSSQHPNPLVRIAMRADSRRMRKWEAAALAEFDHVFALSDGDRERLLSERPDLAERVSVWPIPVQSSPLPAPAGPPRFIVLGALSAVGRVNGLRWFMSHVWPGLRERAPDARLEVVGARPPTDIRQLDGTDGVRVHGFVEDLEAILPTVTACVIPLFVGSGVRVKVLELIARGIPCVGTPVALQGLMPLDGCVEVSEPDEWVRTLAQIAADPGPSRELARRGAGRLATDHSPGVARARVEQVLQRMALA
jgi:glycosyltransferase involved in cell wall biosynthesis